MKVLFVGCNPTSRNTDPAVPFEGTRSGVTLKGWIKEIGVSNYTTVNAISMVSNTASSVRAEDKKRGADVLARIVKNNDYTHIITLGKVAHEVIKLAGLQNNTLNLPHPSGLNRALNNKKEISRKLKACKEWLAL